MNEGLKDKFKDAKILKQADLSKGNSERAIDCCLKPSLECDAVTALAQTQTKLDAAVKALGKIEAIAEQIDFMRITDDPCDVDDRTDHIEILAMETLKEIKK